ncbi:MAG: hypothetical protein WC565_08550 [Parcubacteria group bacterium]|jgi:hypothetical protein
MPRKDQGALFASMARTHIEVANKHGFDCYQEAIEWLASHVGHLSERVKILEQKTAKLERAAKQAKK